MVDIFNRNLSDSFTFDQFNTWYRQQNNQNVLFVGIDSDFFGLKTVQYLRQHHNNNNIDLLVDNDHPDVHRIQSMFPNVVPIRNSRMFRSYM